MAYADQESSVDEGSPFFLYEFTTDNGTYRFTDYPEAISAESETWASFAIKHDRVKQSTEISKNSIKVSIPLIDTNEFCSLFIGWAPDYSISLTLRRGHFGSTDTLVYWKGRISSHNLKQQLIELNCESIFTSMRRSGVRARFQRLCRHPVYSTGCGLDKDNFATVGEVSAVSGLTLTIVEADAEDDGYFTGGAILFADGSYRMITNHVGSAITISRPNRYISDNYAYSGWGGTWGSFWGSFSATLYPGCDRTAATCLSKFNNLLNNGGFKYIPEKNPMGGSSIV